MGAGIEENQGSLRQPFEGESTEVLEDGTGSYKSNVPGIFRGFSKNIRVQISLGEKGEETNAKTGTHPKMVPQLIYRTRVTLAKFPGTST